MNKQNPLLLVTGASGFVGGHLALDLANAGFRVAALGGSRAPCVQVSKSVEVCERCDLSDSRQVNNLIQRLKPDAIVHCAALANASVCEKNPERAHLANVVATRNLVSAGDIRFIFVSTDLAFDGAVAPKGGFLETDLPQPRSVYAKTKVEAENFVLDTASFANIVRICLVYGTQMEGRGGFLSWMRSSLEQGESVKLFTDEWRTPIFSKDVSRAIEAILAKEDEAKANRVIHVAGSERISRYDFGLSYARRFGFDESQLITAKQSDFSSAAPRSPDVSLNNKLLIDRFGVEPLSVVSALSQM